MHGAATSCNIMDNNPFRWSIFNSNEDLVHQEAVFNWIVNSDYIFFNASRRKAEKRQREVHREEKIDFWKTSWGLLITDPRTRNPESYLVVKFYHLHLLS